MSSLPCHCAGRKVSGMLRLIQADGGFLMATRAPIAKASTRARPGRVTVPGKPSDGLAPGALNSILEKAGLKLGQHDGAA